MGFESKLLEVIPMGSDQRETVKTKKVFHKQQEIRVRNLFLHYDRR